MVKPIILSFPIRDPNKKTFKIQLKKIRMEAQMKQALRFEKERARIIIDKKLQTIKDSKLLGLSGLTIPSRKKQKITQQEIKRLFDIIK